MITKEEINALADIVGDQWVSTAPCMMDTYSFYMNPEVLVKDGGRFAPRPEAVVLPASTEEVQAILRYCNTTDLMVKPLSTGFGTWAAVSRERVVVLDLKRMNRIIDIDVKNQIAIIEPYVKAIDLQTELFKHGLNVHVVSSGGNHSVLASTTAAWGYGLTGSSMSYSGRNLLGAEWVLPTGEVVQLGSSGSKSTWFSADGPGPSMRGVMRGFQGSMGGLGVFTKCAVKLYKWDGPKKLDVGGASPNYVLNKVPARMAMNALAFPSVEEMREAGYKLGEAEIDYSQFRTPMFFTATGATDTNADLKAFLDSGLFQKMVPCGVIASAVVGYSEGEFKYKMKVLKQILKETKGIILPLPALPSAKQMVLVRKVLQSTAFKKALGLIDDPFWLPRTFPVLKNLLRLMPASRQMYSKSFWLLIRHAVNTQGCFRPSSGMFTSLGAFDTWDLGVEQSNWIATAKQAYIGQKRILDDGGDLGSGGTFESGHMGYLEGIGLYDPARPECVTAAGDLVGAGVQASIDKSLGIPIAGFGMEGHAAYGPECRNYHNYMAKIKRSLDPHTASDPFFYTEPEPLKNE
jgi:glycolate oxidase